PHQAAVTLERATVALLPAAVPRIAWGAVNAIVFASQPPAPREVPAALWTLGAPFYASVLLGIIGLLLCLIAGSLLHRARKDAATNRVDGAREESPRGYGVTATLGGGVVCIAPSPCVTRRGRATVRRLPAPQQAVFGDCNPGAPAIAALLGVIALGVFLAETLSVKAA